MTTSVTRTEKRPTGPRVEWVRIQGRDRVNLFVTDRDTTQVAAVDGGWLFRFRHHAGEASRMSTQALTFVPDPEHRWTPREAKPRWEGPGRCGERGLQRPERAHGGPRRLGQPDVLRHPRADPDPFVGFRAE